MSLKKKKKNTNFQKFIENTIEQLQGQFVNINESLLSVSKILSLSEWTMKPCPKNCCS